MKRGAKYAAGPPFGDSSRAHLEGKQGQRFWVPAFAGMTFQLTIYYLLLRVEIAAHRFAMLAMTVRNIEYQTRNNERRSEKIIDRRRMTDGEIWVDKGWFGCTLTSEKTVTK